VSGQGQERKIRSGEKGLGTTMEVKRAKAETKSANMCRDAAITKETPLFSTWTSTAEAEIRSGLDLNICLATRKCDCTLTIK